MIIHCALISALCVGLSMGQFGGMGMGGMCPQAPQCFQQCQDTTLANAFPFIRQTPIGCAECMALCTQLSSGGAGPFMCMSAVYDCNAQSCDIFAVADAQSMGSGGRRKRGGNGGGNGGGCNNGGCKKPQKKKYPGRIYLLPTGLCPADTFGGATTAAAASGATTAAGGASTSGGGAVTTAASTAATTTMSPAKKKMIKDSPMRRKDAVSGSCIVKWKNGRPDCKAKGIRFVGHSRYDCRPSITECNSAHALMHRV